MTKVLKKMTEVYEKGINYINPVRRVYIYGGEHIDSNPDRIRAEEFRCCAGCLYGIRDEVGWL